MRLGLETYRAQANYARSYFEFLQRCGLASPATADYYEALIARCDRRADVYEPARLSTRLRHLTTALTGGVYGSRKGGYHPAAFAKDLVEVFTNLSRRGDSL
jgi:hypothetical protein